jgi:hypothetical protein
MLKSFVTIISSLLILSNLVSAQSAVIIASKDNTLYESGDGSLSNGQGIHIFTGKTNQSTNGLRRALVYFPISDVIPAEAQIDSVILSLTLTKSGSGNQDISIYRVTSNWGEGASNAGTARDGDGAASQSDDATWIHTFYNSEQWNQAGGDYVENASATISIPNTNKAYFWGSTTQMVSDVQSWLDNPESNFGWIVIGNESANKTTKKFASRENSTESSRPSIAVFYSQPNAISNQPAIAQSYSISQNYPNPFNPETRIDYFVPAIRSNDNISITVYNIVGQRVRVLLNTAQEPGYYSVIWDATNDAGIAMPTGVYYYSLRAGTYQETKKMFLIR